MPTYTVGLYSANPSGIFTTGVGSTFTWSGGANQTGTATITDNEANFQGYTLDDDNNGNETATATVTIGGNTSVGSNVDAELSWTIRDTVTGEEFDVSQLQVENGAAAGFYTLSERPLIPGRVYEVVAYDSNPNVAIDDPGFNITNYIGTDDVVTGTSGDDTITTGYADHDNDSTGGTADEVATGAGNDSVVATGGNDTIRGGGGNDTLNGGTGDDVITGDNGALPATSAEILNWEAVDNDEDDVSGGITQITGEIEVNVTFTDDGTSAFAPTIESTDTQFVPAGESFNSTSSLALYGNGTGETSVTDITFAAADGSEYADAVENVSFAINDIDSFGGNHIDQVTVNAYDADGNPVTVTLTAQGNDVVAGNAITAGPTLDDPGDADGSVLVEIDGPVARIEIIYSNILSGTHGINITDVHFDAVLPPEGDDSLVGGAGDDTLLGEGGNDTLIGGTGSDSMVGGAGSDSFTVAQGDTAEGGAGDDIFTLADLSEAGNDAITITGGDGAGTDNDTLILTSDISHEDITYGTSSDTGALSGSFTMADGTVVTFDEIENIICFTPGTMILTDRGERAVESLRLGDMIMTRDHGPQPLRWRGASTVPGRGKFAPVRIASHVTGARRSLLVSPQHRILFEGYECELLFGSDEVLAAATHLEDGCCVVREPRPLVTYVHLMLDQHEIIYAEGAATESFFAGETGLSAISGFAREELFTAFPHLRDNPASYGATARVCLKAHEARLLMKERQALPMAA